MGSMVLPEEVPGTFSLEDDRKRANAVRWAWDTAECSEHP